MCFQEVDETVTFYIGPHPNLLPPQGPIGATLWIAMNNLYSSLKKVSTHYITWLFYFWMWRRILKFACFWPLGALPLGPHINFEFPAPKDDSCQVLLKSDHAFSRRWNTLLFTKGPPPQPVTLHRGPLGPPWELLWTTFILHLTRYLHTT